MPLPDHIREQTPTHFDEINRPPPYEVRERRVYFRGSDPWPQTYWTHNTKVFWGQYLIRGADAASLRFYSGGFAKDHKHCYIHHSRLKDAHGPACRALNYTYATDGRFVWTIGGKLKDVDAGSFVPCDDGIESEWNRIDGSLIPYSYGKDRNRVYYYDFDGTPNWVRKALAPSFESLNDGYFGRDEKTIFWSAYALPKADVASWQKLDYIYSRDRYRAYYSSSIIPGADAATFEVIMPKLWSSFLARDRNHFYLRGVIIDQAEFERQLAQ